MASSTIKGNTTKNIWNLTDFTADSVASTQKRTVTLNGKHLIFNYYYNPLSISSFKNTVFFTINNNRYAPSSGEDIYGTAMVVKSTSNECQVVPIRLHKNSDDNIWRIQGVNFNYPSSVDGLTSNSYIAVMLEWDIA